MIDDVDAAIAGLLQARLRRGTTVLIGPPPQVPTRQGRTLSLLLHDLREDLSRRALDPEPVRGPTGRTLSRQVPPRRFHLSYLVTASAPDTAAEHRLLGEALAVLAGREQVPAEFVGGELAGLGVPVLLAVWPERTIVPVTDIWASLGLPLRPSVDLRVTSALVPPAVEEAGPPVVERVLEFDDTAVGAHEQRREPPDVVERRRATLIEGRGATVPGGRRRRS